MSEEKKKRKIRDKDNEKPLKIDGDFLEVFKEVKKDKERKAKEDKEQGEK